MKNQIFQSQSSTRWNRFVWVVRIAIVFIIIGVTSILFSLFRDSQYNPGSLLARENRIQNININPQKKKITEAELLSFVKHLKKVRNRRVKDFYKHPYVLPDDVKGYLPVRAAFYVNWDSRSASSLKNNVSKLNMVLPE